MTPRLQIFEVQPSDLSSDSSSYDSSSPTTAVSPCRKRRPNAARTSTKAKACRSQEEESQKTLPTTPPRAEVFRATSRRRSKQQAQQPMTMMSFLCSSFVSAAALQQDNNKRRCKISPRVALPILVLIDMFAVSLVVPLLFQYYKAAGVNNAHQRELLSSLFSSAQIVGGLCMGVLTDAKLVQRRTILFLSFGGSALSYGLIAYGGLSALIVSRVLVGLVKQTMTVATAILTRHTHVEDRTKHMGRLTASSTVAWIVGPSIGALLFRYVDRRAPPVIACLLFLVNVLLAALLLDHDEDEEEEEEREPETEAAENETNEHETVSPDNKSCAANRRRKRSFWANLRSCFSSRALASAIMTKLIATWVTKATASSQLGSFYENMYGLEPHQRGYISSYQQFLQFVVQSTLVGPVLAWSGGERQTTCFFTTLLAFTVFLESQQSLPLYLLVLCPIISLCYAMTNLSLQSLVTHVAPTHSIFSVLAALDVLQNAVSVSVPFYRTMLFRFLAPQEEPSSGIMMHGDPDPIAWIQSSALHWAVAAISIWCLLLSNESLWRSPSTMVSNAASAGKQQRKQR